VLAIRVSIRASSSIGSSGALIIMAHTSPICSFYLVIVRITRGVARGLGQGEQNLAEGGHQPTLRKKVKK